MSCGKEDARRSAKEVNHTSNQSNKQKTKRSTNQPIKIWHPSAPIAPKTHFAPFHLAKRARPTRPGMQKKRKNKKKHMSKKNEWPGPFLTSSSEQSSTELSSLVSPSQSMQLPSPSGPFFSKTTTPSQKRQATRDSASGVNNTERPSELSRKRATSRDSVEYAEKRDRQISPKKPTAR